MIGVLWGAGGANEIDSLSPAEAEPFSIFRNNFLVGISIIFLGGITGGIYGCAVLFVNGYLLGELLQYLWLEKMYQYMLMGLLPHMGLELVGLISFVILGFVPIGELGCWMKNGRMTLPLKDLVKRVSVLFLFGAASLLAASLIEGTVSVVA